MTPRGEARDGAAGGQRPSGARHPALFPALAAVLTLAALLRFQGLGWGLPNASHWFSYHPDEILVLGAAARVDLLAGQWDPGFYNYGSLLIYLISITAEVVNFWAPLPENAAPYIVLARLTWIGRGWVALFGVATVYVVYLTGRRLGGPRLGFLAAAAMAVVPMHAVHSHFATVDVPATFWVSLALYNALRYPERRAALWCGLAAGVAAGTKYNAGLVLTAGWAAAALAPGVARADRWRSAATMAGAAAAAMLCSTPGILFSRAAFLRDFGFETQHVRTGHGLVFEGTGPGWWYHLSTNLWQGVGALLPPAALAALGILLWRRRFPRRGRAAARPALILLAFAAPYFAVISAVAVRFQRYDLPLLPALALGAGALFVPLRGRWAALPAMALLGTLALAQGMVSTMSAPRGILQMHAPVYKGDPRDAVVEWLAEHVPQGTRIGLTAEPWFYTPPLTVANAGPQSRPLLERTREQQPYPLILPDAEGATAWADWPDFVVTSDYEIGDAIRLQGAAPPERIAQVGFVPVRAGSPPEAQRLTRLWNNLQSRYRLVNVWSPTPHVFGLRWAKRRLPPHDAFYPYPTLFIFQRKPPAPEP